MKVIVFAGGVGTRLWPLSRKNTPKQFGQILGDQSTLQQTIARLTPRISPADIYVATGRRYEHIVKNQLPQIPEKNFIFEPEMRDVGPAIGLASFILEKNFPDEPIAIIWSDHLVKKEEEFRSALALAESAIRAQKGKFVFIAQKPRFANQNMGWIEIGELESQESGISMYPFMKLRYRPTLEEAQGFFANKNFVWNLGYFVTTPRYLKSLFLHFAPTMYQDLLTLQEAYGKEGFEEVVREIYPKLEKISFDDLILVKLPLDAIYVISLDLGWSDVGAWEALKEALAETEDENVTKGKVMVEGSRDSLVFNYTGQMVVGIDLNEYLIINTEDVVLVCPKTSVPKIKKLVEGLTGTPHEHLA